MSTTTTTMPAARREKSRTKLNGQRSSSESANHSLQMIEQLSSSGTVPSMYVLRQVITQLDMNDADFVEELEMQSLKEKVIGTIRRNRDLEAKIEEADRRIGSLIRNCQLVTSKHALHALKCATSDSSNRRTVRRGINDFSQEGKDKLMRYENLFHLMQTKPQYLSKLLIHESKGRISAIQKTCIYNLFAYCVTERESYLLLNLFSSMMQEEVMTVIKNPVEFIRGDPMTIGLAIDFYRSTCISSLFSRVKSLVVEVIHAKHTNLSIDPITIYKNWIKDREAETGRAMTNMPVHVTAEQALRHPEVVELLHKAVDSLIRAGSRFMQIFATDEFIAEVPYGMRFLSRQLWQLLSDRFPSTSQKELLKIMANIIYYRFIGTCIVCPEVYGVVKLRPGERISCEARNNLGNISKLLSAAATGSKNSMTSDIDFYQSLALTTFLNNAHENFVSFFRSLLQIEQPEDYFEVNQFSEETLISPPQISLKVTEMVELHQWLWEARQLIAPDPQDPMNEILNELGSPPTHAADIVSHANPSHHITTHYHGVPPDPQETEITLTLRNRKPVVLSPEEQVSSRKIKVKQGIVELIRHRRSCHDLNEVFFRQLEPEEEELYRKTRDRLSVETTPQFRSQSIIFSPHGQSLESLSDFVRLNFQCMGANTFDEIAIQILHDVRDKIENRERFKADLERMRVTLIQLKEKRENDEKILTFYKEYITKCLENMKRMTLVRNGVPNERRMHPAVRYSAKQLKEKGVLISIKDIDDKKLKDVTFEMNGMPEDVGLFLIRMKFKGMEVERVKIELQYLLELQYKSIPTLDLTDRTKVSITHLIYLLNKKFFSVT